MAALWIVIKSPGLFLESMAVWKKRYERVIFLCFIAGYFIWALPDLAVKAMGKQISSSQQNTEVKNPRGHYV